MKTLSLSILFLFTTFHSYSQKKKEEELFTAVEQQAEFPGGMGALAKLLFKNSPNFKKEDNAGIGLGKIHIQLIIEKDGGVSNIEISKNGGMSLETEKSYLKKLRAIFSEKWKPGFQNKKPVRSRFIVPVRLCLSE